MTVGGEKGDKFLNGQQHDGEERQGKSEQEYCIFQPTQEHCEMVVLVAKHECGVEEKVETGDDVAHGKVDDQHVTSVLECAVCGNDVHYHKVAHQPCN